MRVVIDDNIPFIKGILEQYCHVIYERGERIDRDIVKDADALIIRTRTKCTGQLLQGSNIKAIFTATIGEDHIDKKYCAEHGIAVFNAAGCNSGGVVQYVVTALFAIGSKKNISLKDSTIGVIGAGNVGERLARFMERAGLPVMRCDPPKAAINSDLNYFALDIVLERCNIITLHVPLNETTANMVSGEFVKKMQNGAILINTSRGEVVDEMAVIDSREKFGGVISDVWRNEPDIMDDYLAITDIATPHIAGYSYEGKINATVFTLNNFSAHFKIGKLNLLDINKEIGDMPNNRGIGEILSVKDNTQQAVAKELLKFFDIWEEDAKLRNAPKDFEKIRREYNFRREFIKDLDLRINELLKL